jgi:KDO2-lipid IV(A) lauroyltransferase
VAKPFRQVGTVLKYGAIHRLLDLGKIIPADRVAATANTLGSTLAALGPLRRRVQRNMELALGPENVPAGAAREYFLKLGMWGAYAMQIYHRGLVESGVTDWLVFDDSVSVLEEALARGKGVIYATPHLIAHEITAGIMARKYPTVGLVRESKYAPHMRVKERYYVTSGGCNVIFRPRRGNVTSDMRVCTRSLKDGNILVITPDLLSRPGEGVVVEFLGRKINLRPGIITLAMVTGAPVVRVSLHWEEDRVLIHCEDPREYPRTGDHERTFVGGMQDWCDSFAAHLRRHPSNWQFWLDRHWSRVWEAPAQQGDE